MTHTLVLKWDESSEMASLSLDGVVLNEGNEWDFHPFDVVEGIRMAFDQIGVCYDYQQEDWAYDAD